MTTTCHDDGPITGDRSDGRPATEAFAVRTPRTLVVRLFGRNPLVRAIDRVEALILVLAFAVSVIAVPVAAAVGMAVHESRSRTYAEQAQTLRTVVATITGDSDAHRNFSSATATAPARWFAAGTEHHGVVTVQRTAKPGDTVKIRVDDKGSPVAGPAVSAPDEAVATALAIWFGVVIAAAALFGLARTVIDRLRYAAWQRSFDRMVGVAPRP
jgi:hypothetical protein